MRLASWCTVDIVSPSTTLLVWAKLVEWTSTREGSVAITIFYWNSYTSSNCDNISNQSRSNQSPRRSPFRVSLAIPLRKYLGMSVEKASGWISFSISHPQKHFIPTFIRQKMPVLDYCPRTWGIHAAEIRLVTVFSHARHDTSVLVSTMSETFRVKLW